MNTHREPVEALCFDLQAHYFPTRYLDELERLGKRDVGESRMQPHATDSAEDLAERFALMDAAGVDVQVLSPAGQQPYFSSEPDAAEAARVCNDLFAGLATAHPERLAAFAVLPLPHVDASLAELDRVWDTRGVVGITIGTSVLGGSIAASGLDQVYAELDRRGAVLYVHPSGLGAHSPLLRDHIWSIGAPIEDTVAATHLIYAGIPARFPRVKIVVAHLGGLLPLVLPRLDTELTVSMPELPSVAARRLWYDSVTHDDTGALAAAVKAFGASRIVYGSDYPYQLGDDYTRSATYVRDADLGDPAVSAILKDNATELLAERWSTIEPDH